MLAKGKFAQAEALLRGALKTTPNDAQLQIRLAEVLRRLNRNEDALTAYRAAGRLLADEGHYVRAIAALKIALEIAPQNVDVVTELIQLELKKGRRPVTGAWERFAPTPLEVAIDYELHLKEQPEQLALPAVPMVDPGVQVTNHDADIRYPLIRRLSDRELAIKSTAQGRWLVVSAGATLNVRFVDDVEQDQVNWEG
jgi:tetratricopeptide (TPR) repeat protein